MKKVDDEIIIKNVLYEKPEYSNLLQLIGTELEECYDTLFCYDNNIDSFCIQEEDYVVEYKYDGVKLNNNVLKIEFDDKDKTFIEKRLFDDNIKVGANSYKVVKFVEENKDMLMNAITVSKNKCSKEFLSNIENKNIKK